MHALECREASNTSDLADALAGMILGVLKENKKVLWLISGGSSLPVAVKAAELLAEVDQSKLSVTLVDEKYGSENHPQSNWYQLHQQGFALNGAHLMGILHSDTSLADTASNFEELLERWLSDADFAIGQFGIGDGYHTGGIVAHTPAARSFDSLACSYEINGEGKVTITPGLIKKLDVAFINSMGENKRPLVEHFCYSEASIEDEPTQALKEARRTLLYSDVLPVELIQAE